MGDDQLENLILFTIGLVLFVIFTYWLIKDIRFYRKNGWDLEQDSGSPNIHPGVEGDTSGKPFSNSAKVYFAYPLIILTGLVFMLASIFAELN